MAQRIAPNNQLPATHYIPMYSYQNGKTVIYDRRKKIGFYDFRISIPSAIFRIRQNKLPTKHKF